MRAAIARAVAGDRAPAGTHAAAEWKQIEQAAAARDSAARDAILQLWQAPAAWPAGSRPLFMPRAGATDVA
jgi:hypothetical protein